MIYKETLFFIGKCLTINHEGHNRVSVEKTLKETTVDWDAVVKVSTGHFVFPALYCNLKKANFLQYLPKDLVEYMVHITNLNRERNEQIITQAKELNRLLLANNITPIFLKGTGNLLEGLYDDIAERMVGDIDFLVSKQEYLKTIDLLLNFEYHKIEKTSYDSISFKHYPRLVKNNNIAAIEIHKELLKEEYVNEFNFSRVKDEILVFNSISVLSYNHQLSLSVIANQINDSAQHYHSLALRNCYDIFLLSTKTNSLKAVKQFKNLFPPLNNYLYITKRTLNSDFIDAEVNMESELYFKKFNNSLVNKFKQKKIQQKLFIKDRLDIIFKAFVEKKHRKWILKRLSDKNWQREKLIQIGLKKKKTKPKL